MTRAIAHTYNLAAEYRLHITYALFAACAALVLAYGINVYSLISHTIAIQKVQGELLSSNNSLRDLDSKYIALSGTITPNTLRSYGFEPAQVSEFISRTTVLGSAVNEGASVAIRSHEF